MSAILIYKYWRIELYSRHLRPDMILVFSASCLKDVLDRIDFTRSSSLVEAASKIFCVASIQAIGSFKKLFSSSLRKPISTITLTNSGNPWYLRVFMNKALLYNGIKPERYNSLPREWFFQLLEYYSVPCMELSHGWGMRQMRTLVTGKSMQCCI